ncbi:MAG: T9SS type A sorting domain-containing protein [Bacteroidota bacterium]
MKKIATQLKFAMALLLATVFIANPSKAQLTSFHKLYKTEHFTHCYDVAPTLDQGYIITGFEDRPAPFNMPLVPYLSKIDCTGEVEWVRKYGQTTGIDNTDPRVAALNNGNYIMATTVLEADYDILVVCTEPDGEALWKNTYGGSDKDVARGLLRLQDDHLVVVGTTESYGTDTDSPYTDMYALKINSETGDTIWTKSFGNRDGIDDLWDVTENANGDLTFIGRSFHDNGIWLSVIKTDRDGELLWTKFYGKTNHQSSGFDIIGMPDGGYAITGMTTIAKIDFNALVDAAVIRTDEQGNVIWATTLHGTSPDLSEVGSTVLAKGDTLIVALETTSYPDPSPDLTKRMLYFLDAQTGTFLEAKSFNGSGGQFPMIRKDWTGYIMSGMTDEFAGSWNDPMLVKLDDDFESGCQETDWSLFTVGENPVWDVVDGDYTIDAGSFVNGYAADSLGSNFVDSTICFTGTIPAMCETITSTSESPTGQTIQVYPNPTNNLVQIELDQVAHLPTEIHLYNVQGRNLKSAEFFSGNQFSIDLSPFPSGIYFLRVRNGNGNRMKKVRKW